jgi:hypothetical protein
MTQSARTSSWLVIAALATAGTVAIPMVVASRPDAAREVRLVVRDMTFYVDGDTSPNPTLRFKRGEQIRLVLRNDDPGMTHDVAIRACTSPCRSFRARANTKSGSRCRTPPGRPHIRARRTPRPCEGP